MTNGRQRPRMKTAELSSKNSPIGSNTREDSWKGELISLPTMIEGLETLCESRRCCAAYCSGQRIRQRVALFQPAGRLTSPCSTIESALGVWPGTPTKECFE